jgi:hypothetical protein
MPVREITDAQLVERVMRNLRNRDFGHSPAWVVVMETFGLGSTYSEELCRLYGIDPNEQIPGVTCDTYDDENEDI